MLTELTIHKLSQLVYLDLPNRNYGVSCPTVGHLAAFYLDTPVGQAYLKARFGNIPQEYESWIRFLTAELEDVKAFKIHDVLDDNKRSGSGCYGCCYTSPQNDLIVAFRGSEMLGNRRYKNDYETDFALAYADITPQQKVVGEYLTQNEAFSQRDFYITGHSLGGNLAVYGAICAKEPHRVNACYAFNAPGFNQGFLKQNSDHIAMQEAKLHLMQNEHDMVSSLLYGVTEPVVLESLFDPLELEAPDILDMLYPHSNFMFRQTQSGFIRKPGGVKDPLCNRISTLSQLFLQLPGGLKKTIAKLLLEVLYSSTTPQKQLQYLFESVTKQLVHNNTALSKQILPLTTGVYAAKQLSGASEVHTLYKTIMQDTSADSHYAEAIILLTKALQQSAAIGGGQ